jgi:hypothetical protein
LADAKKNLEQICSNGSVNRAQERQTARLWAALRLLHPRAVQQLFRVGTRAQGDRLGMPGVADSLTTLCELPLRRDEVGHFAL